jgi:hypothetical protein
MKNSTPLLLLLPPRDCPLGQRFTSQTGVGLGPHKRMVTASLRRTTSVCSQAFLSQPANSDHPTPTSNFTHPCTNHLEPSPIPNLTPVAHRGFETEKKIQSTIVWVAVLGSLGWLGGGARAWARGAGGGGGGGRWRPRHRVSCGPAHAPRQGFETRSPRRAGLLAGRNACGGLPDVRLCAIVGCVSTGERRLDVSTGSHQDVTGAHRTRLPVKPPERSRSGRASQTSMDTERSRPLHYFTYVCIYEWVGMVGCTFWLYVLVVRSAVALNTRPHRQC